MMKPKEVVISAMKQPQKRTEFSLAVSESLIVILGVLLWVERVRVIR